ncbi:hypothetical protein CYMTET_18717 [Cymbomonas tetramitiformis]|uniref:Uncharacterized protein n=1 Tax=Cymbomonas tetramitiformis TaxID=36881 RepID=A0AAE0L5M9_9CHLO|nr:hypothetical protein CYMTET_18717 [Cymbomonas tetramitiformis]
MGLFKKCAPGARVRDFKEEQDPDGIFLRFNGDMERLDPVIWDRNLKTYLGWQPDQFPNVVAKKTSNRDFNMKLDSEVSSEFIRIWQIAEPLIEESLAAGQVNLVAEFRCEILVLQLRNPGLKVRNAVVEAANLSAILEMIESKDKALKPWRKLRELLYAIKKISDECSSEVATALPALRWELPRARLIVVPPPGPKLCCKAVVIESLARALHKCREPPLKPGG